ncbi:short transient receptor potential channel 7-like isoform X4 [Mercenaria mercenaria]|uniref:short transient receptor potential channel 7-like isoform X4 n=1 Tax=Mercenaria mercenaria TaxID=6596 RepID=UPI001E1D4417|nr:short transient receptor potential channel 7-like isoform X4 [Mercenaria mercenaria]
MMIMEDLEEWEKWGSEYGTTADHKRSSAMPSQGSLFTNFEDVQLTDEERVYLNAAYLGDLGVLRQSVEDAAESSLNVNCLDYMGRSALHISIDSEKLDVIEVLLDNLSFNCIEESLLHAISKGATKIVKIITEHPNFMAGEDRLKRLGVGEAFFRTEEKSQFSPDITPLILAAHYNNHEIIQMFLSRNHRIEKPHPISCTCNDCVTKQNYDSLKRSRSRLNAYRALASPAYMALSSPDPIMTTFELRQEMMKLAEIEKEFKSEYLSLVEKCMNFACELMDLCRGTQEVEAVLSEGSDCSSDNGKRDPLARLKMAIRYQEKKFVAHPNCQQHMTSIWYGSEMGFLQSFNWLRESVYAILFLPAIPFLCAVYVIFPNSKLGSIMRCPVTKFFTHTTSHICFLILLAVATFRLSEGNVSIGSTKDMKDSHYSHLSEEEKIESLLKETLRPASTLLTHVQICIVFWILGLLWIECKQIYSSGGLSYFTNYYNFMDYSVLSMYLASYVLRFFTEYVVSDADNFFQGTLRARALLRQGNHSHFNLLLDEIKDSKNHPRNYFMEASRFKWKMDDPEIVSDVLFAIANVISFARTTYLMPAFEVLGPLQISLGRMIGDITRFMVLFTLVLFSFMVGLHNLYWYYGTQRIKMKVNDHTVFVYAAEAFQGLKQTFYSLFWSIFGQVSITDINVKHPGPGGVRQCMLLDSDRNKILCTDGPIKNGSRAVFSAGQGPGAAMTENSTDIVEGVGLFLFGIYHVVIIIVLINMLIAMMSHSFEAIQGDCDVEWKFARTKLWMNYMDDGSTLPVPFNMIPSPKSFCYLWKCARDLCIGNKNGKREYERKIRKTFIKKNHEMESNFKSSSASLQRRRETVCKTLELKPDDTSYSDIMQRLVKRYLFKLERAKDETERCENISRFNRYNLKDSAANIQNIRTEEIELIDEDDVPPPVPDTPRRIQFDRAYDTQQPIPEDQETSQNNFRNTRGSSMRKRKGGGRGQGRKISHGATQIATTLAIPQLDAIQRQQKLLDVRLQHLQASSKENNRIIDDVEFLRRVMTENQKAMFNIIHALGNMQSEIVSLVKCLSPAASTPPPTANAHNVSNSVSKSSTSKKRMSAQDDEESRF